MRNNRKKCRVCLIGLLCLAACGPSSSPQIPTEEGSSSPAVEDKKSFYIYCSDETTQEMIESFLEENPKEKERVLIVPIEGETGAALLENKLADPEGEEYPDLLVVSQERKEEYLEKGIFAPVEQFGISQQDLSQMYDYMLQYGEDDSGTVRALSWMDSASVFVYRTSLAKTYLQITDPHAMEDAISNWEAFADMAEQIKTVSEGTVRAAAELDTIKTMMFHGNPDSWYPEGSEQFVIGDFLMEALVGYGELAEDLTWDKKAGTEEWYAAMSDGTTLGFFGSSYFVERVLGGHCGDTAGDWSVCLGPSSCSLDGVWLGGTNECSDSELAGEILRYVTGTRSLLRETAETDHIAVNHKSLMESLSSSAQSEQTVLSEDGMFVYASAAGVVFDRDEEALNELFWEDAEHYWDHRMNIEEVLDKFVEDAETLLSQ